MSKLKVPTVKEPNKGGWRILSTELGCGLKVLQGWSSGIGIRDNENFEEKMFQLLYASTLTMAERKKRVESCWERENLGRDVLAPISVAAYFTQFLHPKQTYVASSTKDWVERFEAFVTKHGLGGFGKAHVWQNYDYKGEDNITFTWQWNGRCPKASDVGLDNKDYP